MKSKKKSWHKNNGKNRKATTMATIRASTTPSAYLQDVGTKGIKKSHVMMGQNSVGFDLPLTNEEAQRRAKRLQRFGQSSGSDASNDDDASYNYYCNPDTLPGALSSSRDDAGYASHKSKKRRRSKDSDDQTSSSVFVGTCQDLEKPYFRLTTFPKREKVRPLDVLVKSLKHIKHKFFQEEDFEWATEQLKSVRQDITVQHLRNKFVLDVYEMHARLLLENGDLSEFNRCQTMIISLTSGDPLPYDEDMPSKDDLMMGVHRPHRDHAETEQLQQTTEAADEFTAYRILYALVKNSVWDLNRAFQQHLVGKNDVHGLHRQHHGTRNSDTSTKPDSKVHHDATDDKGAVGPSTSHALQVVKAIGQDDFRTFFKMYEFAPHLSAYLMDFLVRRVRQSALERIIAAFRPTVSIEYFRAALFLPDLEETRACLRQFGAVFVEEQGTSPFWVNCRATSLATGAGVHKSRKT